MKFDGRPDGMSLNASAMGRASGFNGWDENTDRYAVPKPVKGGAYVGPNVLRWEFNLTDTNVLTPGNAAFTKPLWTGIDGGDFKSWTFLHAFILVKGFTGGAGGFNVRLGTNSPTWNNLLLSTNAPVNNTQEVGTFTASLGSLLSESVGGDQTYKAGMNSPSNNSLTLGIDAAGFSGTCTAGKLLVTVVAVALDWT